MLMKYNIGELGPEIQITSYSVDAAFTVNAAAFIVRKMMGENEETIPTSGHRIVCDGWPYITFICPDGFEFSLFEESVFSYLYSWEKGKKYEFDVCFAFNFPTRKEIYENLTKS